MFQKIEVLSKAKSHSWYFNKWVSQQIIYYSDASENKEKVVIIGVTKIRSTISTFWFIKQPNSNQKLLVSKI